MATAGGVYRIRAAFTNRWLGLSAQPSTQQDGLGDAEINNSREQDVLSLSSATTSTRERSYAEIASNYGILSLPSHSITTSDAKPSPSNLPHTTSRTTSPTPNRPTTPASTTTSAPPLSESYISYPWTALDWCSLCYYLEGGFQDIDHFGETEDLQTPARELAGRRYQAHTYADLRSAAQARKRARAEREKYYNFRAVKRGQLGVEHYAEPEYDVTCDGLRSRLVSEWDVEVVTKRRLFELAQGYPRPPRRHRADPEKKSWACGGVRTRLREGKWWKQVCGERVWEAWEVLAVWEEDCETVLREGERWSEAPVAEGLEDAGRWMTSDELAERVMRGERGGFVINGQHEPEEDW